MLDFENKSVQQWKESDTDDYNCEGPRKSILDVRASRQRTILLATGTSFS